MNLNIYKAEEKDAQGNLFYEVIEYISEKRRKMI